MWSKVLLAFGATVILVLAFSQGTSDTTPSGSETQFAMVQTLPDVDSLERSCKVKYADVVEVSATMTGAFTLQIPVDTSVKKDDVLGTFDTAALLRSLKSLDAQIGLLQTRIERDTNELSALRETLHENATTRLNDDLLAQSTLRETMRKLVAEGSLSETTLTDADKKISILSQQIEDLDIQHAMTRIEEELTRDRQEFDLLSLNLEKENVEEQLEAATVVAPVSGLASDMLKELQVGHEVFVRQGLPLMSIANPTLLEAAINVTLEDMTSIRNSTIDITNAETLEHATAHIADIIPIREETFSTDAFEVRLHFNVEVENEWVIGADASCRFNFQIKTGGIAIPLNTVMFDNQGPYVNVVLDEETFEMRRVELGQQASGMVQVLNGLKGTEKLVL